VVTLDEKEQLTLMIKNELQRNKVPVGRESNKQAIKQITKRRRSR
jgi:hypothetical protein